MALQNGVLVHGPTAWGCAVRTNRARSGSRPVASRISPRPCGSECRSCVGRSHLPRRSRFFDRSPGRARRRASRSSGRACSRAMLGTAVAARLLRRSKLSAGTARLPPPESRSSRLHWRSAGRASPRITVRSTSRSGRTRTAGRPRPGRSTRAAAHELIAPMVASSLAVNVVAAKVPAGTRNLARLVGTAGAIGGSVEVSPGLPATRGTSSPACSRDPASSSSATSRRPSRPRSSSRSRTPHATPASRSNAPRRSASSAVGAVPIAADGRSREASS